MIETGNSNFSDKWNEYCLIMPVVAVGNVGQLAVDLLLSTLNVKHVGYLNHRAVLPIIGPDPFDTNKPSLMTSWEVFECEEKKLVIVQQRSPVVPHMRESYAEYVIEWFKKHKFKNIILLSSCFSQFFTPAELQNISMQYLCTEEIEPQVKCCLHDFGWKQFTRHSMAEYIPGGGVTELLLKSCEAKKVPLIAMVLACSEGNNYPEAFQMVNALNQWLKLVKEDDNNTQWKIPPSWHMPFGNAPPLALY